MNKKVLEVSTGKLMYDGMTKVEISLLDNAPDDKNVDFLLGKGALSEMKLELDKRNVNYYEGPDREYNVLRYLFFLYKLLRANNYDIIHIHGNSATMALDLLIAKLCNVKVRIAHSHNTVTKHPILHRILQPILSDLTTIPVACGKDAGEFLFGSKRMIVTIPNSIDVNLFKFNPIVRKKIRKELNVDNKIVLGHIGRYSYQKNHNLLIDVYYEYYKSHPNSVLILIGDGELRESIENKINLLGLKDNVIILGNLSNVQDILNAMDIFLLTSRYEGLSVTAIEAQASGLPCLLSDRISKETKISDNCFFVKSSSEIQNWIEELDKINLYKVDRLKGYEAVKASGYDLSNLRRMVNIIWN
ncbi:glycosyltransferase [Ileibacterium valens]|uniref:Uncharacterized protein n=1 Tax=Ileibacterium valens TaxID=1862668 RepID=A0A1U7NEY9_9FIRM|nr:glycosyltransferase [Ileibacterium valens]OLU38469.1 hypothetical protein BM735_09305 [Erysipelotrichaceae bacterium NYU-BL-F16]OLU38504.1 hypothetical protein BO222_08265 [Ileibacterium valens]OLU38818.1 hypothetical protein BO224_08345 [Erysipelotrichaceae bacterium NYU-BL-E8]